MSSKYQAPFTIPEAFPELLKYFTREVLRSQPENIYDFGASFFKALHMQQGGALASDASQPGGVDGRAMQQVVNAAPGMQLSQMSVGELENLVLNLFIEADSDQSGTLDRKEFGAVLRNAKLSLSDRQIHKVMAEADDNDDGVIQYEEFIPIMVDILQGLKAGAEASAALAAVESAIRDEAGYLLRGLPQGELDAMVEKVFRRADVNGNGTLEKHEFRTALLKAGVGFTRKDINLVMSQVDVDDDGLISYEEFVPLCFQILVERFKDELLTNQVLNSHDSLQEMLLAGFQEADVEGGGTLSQRTLKAVLTQLSYDSLGLTALQVLSLVSQAPLNPDGLVPYVPFVPMAAAMVRSLYDVQSLKLRLAVVKEATAGGGGLAAVSQVDVPGLRAYLEDAFAKVDVEGTGILEEGVVMDVLARLGALAPAHLSLSAAHMSIAFAAVDRNADGNVEWGELVLFICEAIEHLDRELYVQSYAAGGAGGMQGGEESYAEGDEEAGYDGEEGGGQEEGGQEY